MKYSNIIKGVFIDRPNRFVAIVKIGNEEHKVHVKNTGRCKELLIKGVEVYLEDFTSKMGTRKLRYSLIGVKKGEMLINMDSQVPNKAVEEALQSGKLKLPGLGDLTLIKREKTHGDSRFDFYLEDDLGNKAFGEVKGVTLERDGIALFPDAPTLRGVKHINGLINCIKEGYKAYVILLVQLKGVSEFRPNYETHKEFGEVLKEAVKCGVNVKCYDSIVGENSIDLDEEIKVIF